MYVHAHMGKVCACVRWLCNGGEVGQVWMLLVRFFTSHGGQGSAVVCKQRVQREGCAVGKGVCMKARGCMGVHGCGYSIAHFMGAVEGCVRACLCGCACVHML